MSTWASGKDLPAGVTEVVQDGDRLTFTVLNLKRHLPNISNLVFSMFSPLLFFLLFGSLQDLGGGDDEARQRHCLRDGGHGRLRRHYRSGIHGGNHCGGADHRMGEAAGANPDDWFPIAD